MSQLPLPVAAAVTAALLGAAAPPVGAQGDPVVVGDRVRAHLVGPPGAPVGLQCEAQVAGTSGDTLRLAAAGGCPAGAYRAGVEVERGWRGSRRTHAGFGLLGGAVVGAMLARVTAGDGCRVAGCDEGDMVVGFKTVGGAVLGAVAGAAVGAFLPAGTQWVRARGPRPLRVAGLTLHPGLHVAFGPRRP